MKFDNRILDDLSRIATGALGAMSGVREEAELRMREGLERVLTRLEVVTREEFEAVKAMAARARADQEIAETRLSAIEAQLAALTSKRPARHRAEPPIADSAEPIAP